MTELSHFNAEATLEASKVTLEDSADLRAIAAVTLLFLPGTFVAVRISISQTIDPIGIKLTYHQTLFSTSFFNFSSRAGSCTLVGRRLK
jgi:hypothetical protein